MVCERLNHCEVDQGAIRINASGFYPAYYANRQRCLTINYLKMKRLRSIWSEGAFAVLKREHNLKRAQKRGLERVSEECLLSALALNLKRIAKAFERRFCYIITTHIQGMFPNIMALTVLLALYFLIAPELTAGASFFLYANVLKKVPLLSVLKYLQQLKARYIGFIT